MNGGSNMLYTHFTEELLGLQGVKITNVKKEENNIIFLCVMTIPELSFGKFLNCAFDNSIVVKSKM